MKKNATFWTTFNIVENHYINIFILFTYMLVIEYIFVFFCRKNV